jgi:hypothetical protein
MILDILSVVVGILGVFLVVVLVIFVEDLVL